MFDKYAKDVYHIVKIDPSKPFFDDITDLNIDIVECTAQNKIDDINTEITAASNMDEVYG